MRLTFRFAPSSEETRTKIRRERERERGRGVEKRVRSGVCNKNRHALRDRTHPECAAYRESDSS